MNIKKPHSCSIVLLTKCLFKCKMCEMWKSNEEINAVSTDEWKSFISSLENVLDGPRELVFSGGEPLLRKDIFELINFGSKRGFKTLMPSNGYLIDENVAKQIAESGLTEIFISLDSINPQTHDFLRGMPGAYERVMRAFDNLRKNCPNLRIGIIGVISGVNHKEIVELAKWVKSSVFLSGIYFQAIAKPFFVPLPDSWYKEGNYGFLWPKDIPAIHRTIDELISLRNAGYPIHNFAMQLVIFKTYFARPDIRARKAACYAGDYVINVNPSGDISLCCFMKPVGNIKKDDIGKLWFSEQSAEMRQKMHNCTINCNNMVNCFFKEGEEEKS
ncbi:MAG: radical SAM protein [Candidatus Omnitrophica bacterium]|nr:radical SAM protein [Candidatus Omnitrophota bacterium]MBU1928351.1 radical SAM protein [Candidatus Omnitrophota bacterium]